MYDLLNDIDSDIASLQKTHFVSNKEVNYDARVRFFTSLFFSLYLFQGCHKFKKKISFKIPNQNRSDDCRKPLLNIIHDNKIIILTNVVSV